MSPSNMNWKRFQPAFYFSRRQHFVTSTFGQSWLFVNRFDLSIFLWFELVPIFLWLRTPYRKTLANFIHIYFINFCLCWVLYLSLSSGPYVTCILIRRCWRKGDSNKEKLSFWPLFSMIWQPFLKETVFTQFVVNIPHLFNTWPIEIFRSFHYFPKTFPNQLRSGRGVIKGWEPFFLVLRDACIIAFGYKYWE